MSNDWGLAMQLLTGAPAVALPGQSRCAHCKVSFVPNANNQKQKYCSHNCKNKACHAKKMLDESNHVMVACPVCGVKFRKLGKQKFCCMQCKDKAAYVRRRAS